MTFRQRPSVAKQNVEILRLRAAGLSNRHIAEQLGLTRAVVQGRVNAMRERGQEVTAIPIGKPPLLTLEQREVIRNISDFCRANTHRQLAKRYGVSIGLIRKISAGEEIKRYQVATAEPMQEGASSC